MRRALTWFLALPLIIAGSQIAHGLAYWWAYPIADVRDAILAHTGHGYLSYAPQSDTWRTAAFLQGLEETGYVANQNVSIEYRWAESQIDRLPALATDLVYHQTAVIAAVGGTLRHLPPRRRLRRFQSSSFSALTLFNPV